MENCGPLTTWLKACREQGELIPMTPELAQKVAKELLGRLMHRLSGIITPKFGSPTAYDMALDQFVDVMERLKDPELILPAYASDTTTLLTWMFRQQFRKFWRALTKDHPELHGGSVWRSLGYDKDLTMDHLPALKPYLDESDLEIRDQVEAALKDIERWQGPLARSIIEMRYLKEMPQTEIAAKLKMNQGNVCRAIQKILFCFARRMQESSENLRRAFGETETSDWSQELEGGGPPAP